MPIKPTDTMAIAEFTATCPAATARVLGLTLVTAHVRLVASTVYVVMANG